MSMIRETEKLSRLGMNCWASRRIQAVLDVQRKMMLSQVSRMKTIPMTITTLTTRIITTTIKGIVG